MDKVKDYKQAGYISEADGYPDEVIFTVPIRIKKSVINDGGFELCAGVYGWTPESTESAPDVCISQIKDFVRSTFKVALEIKANADAQSIVNAQMQDVV